MTDSSQNKQDNPPKPLKKGMTFSRSRLLVFGLVFAAVGGYFLWKGFALSGTTYSITSTVVDGSTISGPVGWTVTISPTPTKVDYYIDGVKNAYVDTSPPFTYGGDNKTLDTTKLSNGKHTLREVATYSNTTVSVSHTITVSNVAPTPTPTPTPLPPPTGIKSGIWISPAELAAKPMSGSAWNNMKSVADGSLGAPNLADQDTRHNIRTMAVALVYARTKDASYRAKAADAIMSSISTESGARSLALGRNIAAYVISADLIDLKSYRSSDDQRFRTWLRDVIRRTNAEGKSVIDCHEKRPNNWGTMCGASRIAADVYLGDTSDLKRSAAVFKGWTGDRSSYAGFSYGDLSWQCNSSSPVGVNPKGCTKTDSETDLQQTQTCSIDGAQPDDMRRGGSFSCSPIFTDYAWGALSAALAQTEMLQRAGFDARNWQDQAMLRAPKYLIETIKWSTSGATTWAPWLINKMYNTTYPTKSTSVSNRLVSFTDWTHSP